MRWKCKNSCLLKIQRILPITHIFREGANLELKASSLSIRIDQNSQHVANWLNHSYTVLFQKVLCWIGTIVTWKIDRLKFKYLKIVSLELKTDKNKWFMALVLCFRNLTTLLKNGSKKYNPHYETYANHFHL